MNRFKNILLICNFDTKQHMAVDRAVSLAEQKPRLHLIEGDPVERIPELVMEQGIDLLVMGTVCRTGIGGFLISNTAEEVLNQIDCSVLTVKPEGFVTPVTLEDN